uniref:Uncharacterized protein n=1 Tax=Prolemur simus TaxID=1328070 RepID=A0A8C8ZZ15_PROSS
MAAAELMSPAQVSMISEVIMDSIQVVMEWSMRRYLLSRAFLE